VDQIFEAASVRNGGIVRRARRDVDRLASLDEVIREAKRRGYHVLETGGQVVFLCHKGQVILHA
jgi:hypothetical protein